MLRKKTGNSREGARARNQGDTVIRENRAKDAGTNFRIPSTSRNDTAISRRENGDREPAAVKLHTIFDIRSAGLIESAANAQHDFHLVFQSILIEFTSWRGCLFTFDRDRYTITFPTTELRRRLILTIA
jgi:hypothetical protein